MSHFPNFAFIARNEHTGSGISFDVSENMLSALPYKRRRFFLVLNIFFSGTNACANAVGETGDQVVERIRTDLRQCPFELRPQVAEADCRHLFVRALLEDCPKFLNRISVRAVPGPHGAHLLPSKVRQVRFAPPLGLGGVISRFTVLHENASRPFFGQLGPDAHLVRLSPRVVFQ